MGNMMLGTGRGKETTPPTDPLNHTPEWMRSSSFSLLHATYMGAMRSLSPASRDAVNVKCRMSMSRYLHLSLMLDV